MNAIVGFGLLAVVVIVAVLVALTAIPARERKPRKPAPSPRGTPAERAERASMERLRSGAAAERVASAAFRSAFAPWDEAPQPARVQETFVPDLPAGEQPLPAETPSNEVAKHEPPPPGELAPWVKEALGGHDGPDAALESIVARVVRDA